MEQGQVSKEDGTESPNQVAVWYSWPLARHASWRCHARRVHLCSPVLGPSVAMPVAHVPIAVSTGPQ